MLFYSLIPNQNFNVKYTDGSSNPVLSASKSSLITSKESGFSVWPMPWWERGAKLRGWPHLFLLERQTQRELEACTGQVGFPKMDQFCKWQNSGSLENEGVA